ncbi:hypothetical protein Y032_0004g1732 [Ancylostoma ceylanicum]|uniref:Uncharacterized protein n=1 Tax=Ancylostoma ceylanicum TaxID=53326 RepID=A0A016VTH8_9BILA|nr:hypothetical protein Y032_0004g1732 [Ancylostoma ceylanicum]
MSPNTSHVSTHIAKRVRRRTFNQTFERAGKSIPRLRQPAVVAIATTAGGRHMDKVNEETPDERGMIIKGAWRSKAIFPLSLSLTSPVHFEQSS